MKALLYSDFGCMPKKDIINMLNKNSNTSCLFCCYADENALDYIERVKSNLSGIFNNVINLTPDYKFMDNVDCVFINGGNIFELIYKLKKYNQFDKIKEMCLNGILYVGNSAGSELFAFDNLFVNDFEPPEINIDVFEYSKGLGLIHKKILVHASKYRYSKRRGLIFDEVSWHNYVKYKIKQKDSIKVGNNAVLVVNNKNIKVKKYPWKYIVEQNSQKG